MTVFRGLCPALQFGLHLSNGDSNRQTVPATLQWVANDVRAISLARSRQPRSRARFAKRWAASLASYSVYPANP